MYFNGYSQRTISAATRLKRLIKQANFNDPTACIEDIEYHSDRKFDKQ